MELSDEIKEQYCYKEGFKRERKKRQYKQLYYKQFGRFIINMKYLDENKILIKYPISHAPVNGFKQEPKSFQLCDFIRHMIKNGEMCKSLYEKIPLEEIKYLEDLLKISRLDLQLDYEKMYDNINDYKERFNLLMKNINNGNNSIEIINELEELIEILNTKKVNKITNEDKIMLMEVLEEMKDEIKNEYLEII